MAQTIGAAASLAIRNLNNEEVCTSSNRSTRSVPKMVAVKSTALFGKAGSCSMSRTSTQSTRSLKFSVAAKNNKFDVGIDDLPDVEVDETGNTYTDLESMLDVYDFSNKPGDKVNGFVTSVDSTGAYVDIGAKAAAYCPKAECSLAKIGNNIEDVLQVGTEREFSIVQENHSEGSVLLSIRRIQLEVAWKRLQQLQSVDVTVTGKVLLINRGGVICEVEHLRGFVPTSHMAPSLMKDPDNLIGQEVELKFLEVDQERSKLVLSNKRATVERDLAHFKVGDVVEGVVDDVKVYGAFVDIGGMNGLLHISQISHERISDVGSVLTVGQKLKVMIVSQDQDLGRISLSTRKLEPTPGDMVRNPQKVYDKADEMAASFHERVAAAEAAARAEEKAALAAGGYGETTILEKA